MKSRTGFAAEVWGLSLASALLFLWAGQGIGAPFTYHDYDTMVADLEALAATYPGLTQLVTAQDPVEQGGFGLAADMDGAKELRHYILRITNEGLGLNKPELLLVGSQHGNEVVGMEASLALARLLLESYGQDPWLTELVDGREIYLVPLANPYGFRKAIRYSVGLEGAEDMNRDHTYDRCSFACSDEQTLSTTGAKTLHELARRHLFRVMLDYHGGIQMILYQWGSPLHELNTESPDARAMQLLGERMTSYGGAYAGIFPVGTATDLLGSVYGPLDDTSYAASWDAANADPAYPVEGWRALGYTVEISNAKRPPESTLGGDADLLTPNGAEDGYVPKSVRFGLAAIDSVEPYVLWTNRDSLPIQASPGTILTVQWQVRGCFEIDETRVRLGTDPDPATNYLQQTDPAPINTVSPCFDPAGGAIETFSAQLPLPQTAGFYHVAPVAKVDSGLLQQQNPSPARPPQSWLVRSRTEEGFFFQTTVDPNEHNSVSGHLYWSAEPLVIEVCSVEATPTPSPTLWPGATFTPTATGSPAGTCSTPTPTLTPAKLPAMANPGGEAWFLGFWILALFLAGRRRSAHKRQLDPKTH